ncbi:hypothetical protein KK083_29310 [Fulvivirgaceae bacterium PWU4]|uniref:Uncharacterized protein n=1 Tax=Chryseosolibacter histidini TaxID=2782349 RepID=A0AAP2DTP2_9BACT|nr:hypothetical protein [Chryseosolibacter histidini]MBT1701027.1 hypothetical protein [Chryseosolibacter histidini]
MTKRNVLLSIIGLAISLVISGVIYYYLFLETIDLFGIDEIKNPEGRHRKILLTALSTSFLTLLIAGLLRKAKYAAIGFAVPSLIGIILMLVIGPTYFNKSNYYEPFNRQRWLMEDNNRLKMARHLVRSKELINLTRDEVIEKLGPGYLQQKYLSYKVWGDDCGLDIAFLNDKVTECWIYVKD